MFDVDGLLLKIQVKSAWFDDKRGNYVVDTRRTKTNRRKMVRATYCALDFDFAVIYLDSLHLFYIIPVMDFIAYGSEIHIVEAEKRQRKPKSASFREAWNLLQTVQKEVLLTPA